jgi:hypothetical protein
MAGRPTNFSISDQGPILNAPKPHQERMRQLAAVHESFARMLAKRRLESADVSPTLH